MNTCKENFKEILSLINKNKMKFSLLTLLFTTSLSLLGVGSYYAKNTNKNIHHESIKASNSNFIDVMSTDNISNEVDEKLNKVFSKENISSSIDLKYVDIQIYKRNIDSDKYFLNPKILENSQNNLTYEFGSKPINDDEIALTDFTTRYFYDYGIKNIYNEVSSEVIRKNLSSLIGKYLVTDYATLKISGIVDTKFDFDSYDGNKDYYEYENLVENSVIFNESVTNKLKYRFNSDKKIMNYQNEISYYDYNYNDVSLNYVHEMDTYKDYIYKIGDESQDDFDIYLNGVATGNLIYSAEIQNKEVTLPAKFNFSGVELNTKLKLDSFLKQIDEYILDYTATKYYKTAYSSKSFDIFKYENKLNKQGDLEEIDKKNAYKLFLKDVYGFGIEYDKVFDKQPHYFKINECAHELVDYLFSAYPDLNQLLNTKLKYSINGEKGFLNFKGINLTAGYDSPISVLSKKMFDKIGFKNNIYSSIHIKKEAVISKFDSFMELLNKNKSLKIFNNKALDDALTLHENSYFIAKTILLSLASIIFIFAFIIYFFDIKRMFAVKKIKNDNNYKNVILYSSTVLVFSGILSLILLPLLTYLSNLIILNFTDGIPLIISGLPGIEYLFIISALVFLAIISSIIIYLFIRKTNNEIELKKAN